MLLTPYNKQDSSVEQKKQDQNVSSANVEKPDLEADKLSGR